MLKQKAKAIEAKEMMMLTWMTSSDRGDVDCDDDGAVDVGHCWVDAPHVLELNSALAIVAAVMLLVLASKLPDCCSQKRSRRVEQAQQRSELAPRLHVSFQGQHYCLQWRPEFEPAVVSAVGALAVAASRSAVVVMAS